MEGKKTDGLVTRVVIIAALVALYLGFGAPSFLIAGRGTILQVCTYSFFHASAWHLAVNCIAIWGLYRRKTQPWRDLILPYVIAVVVSPMSALPPIGFSNVLYAAIGLRTPALSHRWWRSRNALIFLVVTAAMLPLPQFSGLTHIAAFFLAVVLAGLGRCYHSLTDDIRRYL